jgi:hypothetical protein
LKKTWIARADGSDYLPRVIVVKAESKIDARAKVLGWLRRRNLKLVKKELKYCDIDLEEALDLDAQQEIDDWLESRDFNAWRSHVQARYPCSGE